MEEALKEMNEVLASKEELIKDLEDQLQEANELSAQQSKVIESLEEELERRFKQISSAKSSDESEKELQVNSGHYDGNF